MKNLTAMRIILTNEASPAIICISNLTSVQHMFDKNFLEEIFRSKFVKIVAPPELGDIRVSILPNVGPRIQNLLT
ncbi:unnamed protein product [Strongylus vulgaris]|uniref:Uncharacterized protein n=1 Tax=Strongylus vulgaris TaxID=40348 RepID=A0A3P7IHP9_STRVU|nr:unnamed protein product [Strongylus vulgaris]